MAKTSRPKSTPEIVKKTAEADLVPRSEDDEAISIPPSADVASDVSAPETPSEDASIEAAEQPVSGETQISEQDTVQSEREAGPAAAEPREVVRVERKGGFWGMVTGGVIAAASGYGIATYFPMEGGVPAADGPSAEAVAALEGALAGQTARLAAIEDRLGALDDLALRLSSLEDPIAESGQGVDLAPVQAAIEDLDQRLSALELLPGVENGPESAALTERLGAMQAEIELLKGQGETAAASMAAAAAEAEARLAEAEAMAAKLKSEAEDTARKALQSAAIGRIRAAMESGAPFTAALKDLQGVPLPETLAALAESGVPTVTALGAAFPDAARNALDASRRAIVGDSMTDRMLSLLQTATGARSLAPRDGSDPDAILSRAEAAARSGDMDIAIAEIADLPPEGQAELAEWVGLARLRLSALAAVAELSAAVSE